MEEKINAHSGNEKTLDNIVNNEDETSKTVDEKPGKSSPKKDAEKPITGIRKVIQIVLLTIFWFFGSLYLVFLVLDWLNSSGLVPQTAPIAGFDYIPPLGLMLLLVPSVVFGLLARQWRVTGTMVVLMGVFTLFVGDHSLFSPPGKKDPAAYPARVTALTLNVAQFDKGIEKFGAEIEKVRPDVICFQETEDFKKIGYDRISKAFPSYHVGLATISDNAILSLHPIVEFHEVELPSRWPIYEKNTPEAIVNRPHRQFLHAVVDMNGVRVNVLNLRLIAGRGKNLDESPRDVARWGKYLMDMQHQEAKVMADYISKLQGPVIYMGDMNASPNCRALVPLYQVGIDTARSTSLLPQKTFPGDGPYQRLDYVFCTKDLEPVSTTVLPWVLSDHRAVYAVMGMKDTVKTSKE